MKLPHPASPRRFTPAILCLAMATGLAPSLVTAQDATARTQLAGFHKVTVRALSSRVLGASFVRPTVVSGHLEATSPHSFTDADADFSTALVSGTEYWVEITSGPHRGTASLLSSFSQNSLTTEDDLSTYVTAGDTYAIRPVHTLASLFGAANSAGLRAGSNANSADTISIPDGQGGTLTCYYSNSAPVGWRNAATGTADASNTSVYHVDALTITRRWLTNLTLTFAGELRTGPTYYVVQPGQNNLSINQPVGITLTNSSLQSQIRQGDSATADLVWVPNATTTGFKKYYYTPDAPPLTSGWKLVGGGNTDYGTVTLGSGIVIERRDPAATTVKIVPDPVLYGGL